MAKDKNILCGCGAKNGEEIDGQEFEITTLKELLEMLKQNKEIHINYFKNDKCDLDLWLKAGK